MTGQRFNTHITLLNHLHTPIILSSLFICFSLSICIVFCLFSSHLTAKSIQVRCFLTTVFFLCTSLFLSRVRATKRNSFLLLPPLYSAPLSFFSVLFCSSSPFFLPLPIESQSTLLTHMHIFLVSVTWSLYVNTRFLSRDRFLLSLHLFPPLSLLSSSNSREANKVRSYRSHVKLIQVTKRQMVRFMHPYKECMNTHSQANWKRDKSTEILHLLFCHQSSNFAWWNSWTDKYTSTLSFFFLHSHLHCSRLNDCDACACEWVDAQHHLITNYVHLYSWDYRFTPLDYRLNWINYWLSEQINCDK